MLMVSRGDRAAFELLYDRYFSKLTWFAQGFLNDQHKAEDAVQEVFMKIIESPGKFDTDKKFSTWIYTITGNVCKNILRNEQNRARLIKENSSDDLSYQQHVSDEAYLKKQIQVALENLSEKEKNIYSLRFEQELPIKDIAEIINIPEGSVKSGIYYLLKKVAPHLKEFRYEK